MTDPKTAQRAFVERYQGDGDGSVFDELVADDFVDHSPMPGVPPTKDGVRGLFAMLRGAMPDMRVEVHDMIAEGDTVATRKTFVGTQTGELLGQPATNKEIRIGVIDFVRYRDGRITEHWNLVDTYGLLAQLGAIGG
jgi:steroid delta-isomerase-like uncharacterized protein